MGLAVEAGVPIISVTAAKVSMLFPGDLHAQTFNHFIQLAKQMQPCICTSPPLFFFVVAIDASVL